MNRIVCGIANFCVLWAVVESASAETFFYTSTGELQQVVYSDGKTASFSYDRSSNLLTAKSSQASPVGTGKGFRFTIEAPAGSTVTMDMSSLGGGNAVPMYDDGTHGDAVAGDGFFTAEGMIPGGIAPGVRVVDVTINDGGELGLDHIGVSVQKSGPPAWWTTASTRIIKINSDQDNYAVANLGQLKHVATQAYEYLEDVLPENEAKAAVENVLEGFAPDNGTAYTPAEKEENYNVLNLGQLKAVAKPFYDWLISAGVDTRSKLIGHGYPMNWVHYYPWDPATPVNENYKPVNLGQLKAVFSFQVEEEEEE